MFLNLLYYCAFVADFTSVAYNSAVGREFQLFDKRFLRHLMSKARVLMGFIERLNILEKLFFHHH